MMMAGKFQIGDVVPATKPASIYVPGPSRWYALRVAPRREVEMEAWLRKRGVYAFHPVKRKIQRRFGVAREYHQRFLPGYVFARFAGDPLTHLVVACPWMIGALCRSDGDWGILDPKRLAALHDMRKIDSAQAEARQIDAARKRAARKIRTGETALFRSGPMAGFTCEVVELQPDGGAKISFKLFGREVVTQSTVSDLMPLLKGG